MSDNVFDLSALKSRWVEVLDHLERTNRTAWLAVFDARLASVSGSTVHLDFSDREKFAGAHGFELNQRPDFLEALSDSCSAITGQQLRFTTN